MPDTEPFPMFPLGTVLFPSMVLPLHVFEPRYRQLVQDCLASDTEPEFGVALIERGSEVGGGDVRSMVGTVARIVEAASFPDGRYALGCVGTRRLRVIAWLDDDPYPRAAVEPWDEPSEPDPDASLDTSLDASLATAVGRLRRSLALHSELGDGTAPATIDFDDDPVLASYQLSAVAPFGPADKQQLLAAEDAAARLALLVELLDDDLALLQLRIDEG